MEIFGFGTIEILRFLHILIFVYWLGGDLGVYMAAGYVARRDLAFDERMRFLKLLMTLDMVPRYCLILMLPVGFQLATSLGYLDLSGVHMALIWIMAAAWLALVRTLHKQEKTTTGEKLRKLDMGIRYVVLGALLLAGGLGLTTGYPVAAPWLAIKLILFAGVMTLGLLLRRCVAKWMTGFRLLGEDKEKAEDLITEGRRTAAGYARLLWALLMIMGFLGVAKPMP
ncbi:MAG: hypothetical protein D6763_00190 [Alphaproteobacteria bacterium]|nr:MAG: hypothetical protein D6763_00190 [Alphaproteobacteria bacterium]